YQPCQALGAGLAAGTGSRDPGGRYVAQPAVCPGRGEGRALPGAGTHDSAEYALDGSSNDLPQKARREAPTACTCTRKLVCNFLTLLDTRFIRPPCNALTFYAVLPCVYYGPQTRGKDFVDRRVVNGRLALGVCRYGQALPLHACVENP